MSYFPKGHHDGDDVDDFDDFDPTPYGGGYDMALTYGRPLPPSEETCYNTSSASDDFDYDRPQYTSYAEPSAYADEALDNEYKSYARPKPRPGSVPSYGGPPSEEVGYGYDKPKPNYGFQPGMNRPGGAMVERASMEEAAASDLENPGMAGARSRRGPVLSMYLGMRGLLRNMVGGPSTKGPVQNMDRAMRSPPPNTGLSMGERVSTRTQYLNTDPGIAGRLSTRNPVRNMDLGLEGNRNLSMDLGTGERASLRLPVRNTDPGRETSRRSMAGRRAMVRMRVVVVVMGMEEDPRGQAMDGRVIRLRRARDLRGPAMEGPRKMTTGSPAMAAVMMMMRAMAARNMGDDNSGDEDEEKQRHKHHHHRKHYDD